MPTPTVQLNVRITPEAREALDQLAKHTGTSITKTVERLILAAAGRPAAPYPKTQSAR